MATRGRKREDRDRLRPLDEAVTLIHLTINFLQLFLSPTYATRLVIIVLLAVGVHDDRIHELTGVCPRTIWELRRDLRDGIIPGMLILPKARGNRSVLKGVGSELRKEIADTNYHTLQQIADMILEKWHVKASLTAISNFLKKYNIRRLKTGSLPAKADPAKQRAFYEETLLPLMKKAKEGAEALLFVDASHFVFGLDFLGYIYGTSRRIAKTYSGRDRYNVLGAIDFATKNLVTITNDTTVTGWQVCQLLWEIRKQYLGRPVNLVLDNARYQHNKAVQGIAKRLDINLVFLPSYSPNLNLIERLWKFVKTKLRMQYFNNFEDFRKRIDSILRGVSSEFKAIIDSLINEKVQLYDDLMSINESTYEVPKKRKKAA